MPGAIEVAARRVAGWLEDGERVYVHCRAGWQRVRRSPQPALALRDGIDPEDALRSDQAPQAQLGAAAPPAAGPAPLVAAALV